MQPMPAAVTAWRYTLSVTSPAANTPGIDAERFLAEAEYHAMVDA